MMLKPDVAELLAKAKKPNELAPKLHRLYRGKLAVAWRCEVRNCKDFSIWCAAGVAAPGSRDAARRWERFQWP